MDEITQWKGTINMAFVSPKECERVGRHWINLDNNTCYRCGTKITEEVIEKKEVKEEPKVETLKADVVSGSTIADIKPEEEIKIEKPKGRPRKFKK